MWNVEKGARMEHKIKTLLIKNIERFKQAQRHDKQTRLNNKITLKHNSWSKYSNRPKQ